MAIAKRLFRSKDLDFGITVPSGFLNYKNPGHQRGPGISSTQSRDMSIQVYLYVNKYIMKKFFFLCVFFIFKIYIYVYKNICVNPRGS